MPLRIIQFYMKLLIVPFLLFLNSTLYSQNLTQTIRGSVLDEQSKTPLIGVTVSIKNLQQPGTATDNNGNFEFNGLPIGRYELQFSYIGYETIVVSEVLLSSGKETVLEIGLKESISKIEEVTITANNRKKNTINPMGIISGRVFTVEEANRYAGGFDDPGRLVSSFAGVSGSGNESSNAIVIRGNSPKGVLWSLEGVEIPNPNHFDGADVVGGGFVSVLSSQVLSNSDFYSGAFPAEYGNALSGVFDMRFKTGNNRKQEYGAKIGLIGAEVFAEGPFSKSSQASFIFNYRYSVLTLVAKMIPEMNIPIYHDLSFKINIPTKSSGIFSIWGVGAYDNVTPKKPDSLEWKYPTDYLRTNMSMSMGVIGLTYNKILSNKTYLHTTLAATGNSTNFKIGNYGRNYIVKDSIKQDYSISNFILKSFINHKFSTKHKNRTGISISMMNYKLNNKYIVEGISELQNYAQSKNVTGTLRFFTQSNIQILPKLALNLGVNTQYYLLNKSVSIEPRAGLNYTFGNNNTITLGYGNHSRLEPLSIYFVEFDHPSGKTYPNKTLKPTKANHFGLGYDKLLTNNLRFKFEVFYQRLYDAPVIPNSTYSLINFKQEYAFRDSLVNRGKGLNKGIEITLEHFLVKGFYFLVNATFLKSEYSDGFGKWHNSRYDYGYLFNLLGGYEFKPTKKDNLVGINFRLGAKGGERDNPVDEAATLQRHDIVYDESQPFTTKYPSGIYLDINFTYRINKPSHSTQIGLQLKNILSEKSNYEYMYNTKTGKVELTGIPISFPNFFIRFDF